MERNPTTIPRLPGECTERFEARSAYILAGADRSLAMIGQQLGKSTTLMERWSAEDGWVKIAREFDEDNERELVRIKVEAYRDKLELHRARAELFGVSLCGLARKMMKKMEKIHEEVEYNAATLATIAKAYQIGLDLSAHALQLDRLLPMLVPADDPDGESD